MALENKLGLQSSADLAREEERISKKKALESSPRSELFTNSFSMIFMTLPVSCALSISQRATSALHL